MDVLLANAFRFCCEWQGRYALAPGGIGGQCVDLANLWAAARGAQHIWANAVDLLDKAPPAEWDVILNTPQNAPPPGAIVVWGPYPPLGIGGDGHCAVALVADTINMLVLQQNWEGAQVCEWWVMTYGGVRGWLVRKAP